MESPIRFHRSAVALVVSALLAGHANATESVSEHETITVLGETYETPQLKPF